ncbi:MAG: 1-acyl-sn-glycerol-3-phosphate acyltransferase [Clostridia bacterium]|nr:1-acyl-sn-glycerol-3-phosphate acyltransferase [Clostridia bacterium]
MKKKQQKWMKFRHRVVRNVAMAILYPYSKIKYGIKIDKFKEQGDRPYLILYNHQTAFDQFFVGMAFKGPIYYLASEDLFSKGFVSSALRYLVAPIPIKKQTTDIAAVLNCMRVAKEGGTIAIAPEGNRTYSGKTEYMSPSIAMLAKKLKLPIVLYHITGGFGVHPRWSDTLRKGKMHCYVSQVIEPDEYENLTDDELFAIIEKGLFINEGIADEIFKSDKTAEYLERAVYVCPYCGLSEFESHGREIECKKCHRVVIYGDDKRLSGKDFDFKFDFFTEWYDYQKDFVNALDVSQYYEQPMYCDESSFSEVIVNERKNMIFEEANIKLYGNKITVNEGDADEMVFPFDEVTAVSVLGRNKLNIYHNKKVYQLKSGKRFNALKYVNIYYRYKNVSKGDTDGKFLGL